MNFQRTSLAPSAARMPNLGIIRIRKQVSICREYVFDEVDLGSAAPASEQFGDSERHRTQPDRRHKGSRSQEPQRREAGRPDDRSDQQRAEAVLHRAVSPEAGDEISYAQATSWKITAVKTLTLALSQRERDRHHHASSIWPTICSAMRWRASCWPVARDWPPSGTKLAD